MISSKPGRLTALVAAVAAATFGIAPMAASADPAPASLAPAPAPISWSPCDDGFECATVRVPLDYDQPQGPKISLALIRLPAGDPGERIGSLFLNPGGPGGSGVEIVRGIAEFMPPELTWKFDLVGFDPRGIIGSTPLLCFDSLEDAVGILPPFPFPRTEGQEARQRITDETLADACARRGGDIRDHMSTADVARDLDLLRQAVGDDQLSYLGFSYGSYLGQVYANLYPDRVRAVVIDGVLDPIAWATGRGDVALTRPFSMRLRSSIGARLTLGQFFGLCDAAGDDCAFSGDARQRFDDLAQGLKKDPIATPDGPFSYEDLISTALGAMYTPPSWPDFAEFLLELEEETSPDAIGSALAAVLGHLAPERGEEPAYPNVIEGFPGVACSDTINPPNYGTWPVAADQSQRRQGYFGRLWTWASSACQPWPDSAGEDRYLGPWRADTSAPVLVVGNHFDPATPYRGALVAHDLLRNSSLLTYAGWGHTAFLSGNTCIDLSVTQYLVTQETPTPGTVCEPKGTPFGLANPIAEGRLAAVAAVGLPMLPESVRRAISSD